MEYYKVKEFEEEDFYNCDFYYKSGLRMEYVTSLEMAIELFDNGSLYAGHQVNF